MKKWEIPLLDKKTVMALRDNYGLPVFTAILLTIRGIVEREDIERFFAYNRPLDDPFLIKDMDKAVERIRRAAVSYEKICIYGDYDCDGVTSTAILYSYLESVSANVIFYIPDRNSEGYGMNKAAVKKLKDDNVSLIITVDNGISAIDEINYANELGMEVIVTDHHKPLDILPKAVAVINPHRADETYDFKDYCGAGIALKLITALEGNELFIMENYSDLAALGTVADIVPLEKENRDIVKRGIFQLENSERPGIVKLLDKSGVSTVNAGSIGFKLGPRINAAGRLGSPYDALNMLLTEDPEVAEKKAELLNDLNSQRQHIENEIARQAEEILAADPLLSNNRVLVISSKGWNAGVIGIVSSRITEKYGKPSILISEDGDVCKASGRSVSGFSIVDAIFACSGYLEKYGGHPMAVGFSIKKENIAPFIRAINEYADKYDYMPLLSIKADTTLNPETIVLDMVEQLKEFEPFGCGNPKPVFVIKGATLDKITPVGNGNHLKLSISKNQARLNLMQFNMTAEEFPYLEGMNIDAAIQLEKNVYQGKESVSFIVKDIRIDSRIFDTEKAMMAVQDYELYRRGKFIAKKHNQCPTRDDFKVVYVYLLKNKRKIYSIDALSYEVDQMCSRLKEPQPSVGVFKLMIILDMMKELFLIDYKRVSDNLFITLRHTTGKTDIRASGILNKLKEDIKNAGKN